MTATPLRAAYSAPARRSGHAVRATTRHRASTLGATLVRMALVALAFVLVALATRAFASSRPITLPIAVVAVAGLGAAAVAEANRRWQPGAGVPAPGARHARASHHTISPSRRADRCSSPARPITSS